MNITSVEELIRAARKGHSQKDFAVLLGVKQSSVSRYESGKTNPPRKVIDKCLRLVHTADCDDAPTAEQLANRVRATLSDPVFRDARLALSRLVDAFETEHVQARGELPAHQ